MTKLLAGALAAWFIPGLTGFVDPVRVRASEAGIAVERVVGKV